MLSSTLENQTVLIYHYSKFDYHSSLIFRVSRKALLGAIWIYSDHIGSYLPMLMCIIKPRRVLDDFYIIFLVAEMPLTSRPFLPQHQQQRYKYNHLCQPSDVPRVDKIYLVSYLPRQYRQHRLRKAPVFCKSSAYIVLKTGLIAR